MSYPPSMGSGPGNMPGNSSGSGPASVPFPPANYGAGYGYAASPLETLLAPARRAGLIMFIVGAATLLVAALAFLSGATVDSSEFQQSPQFQAAANAGWTARGLRNAVFIAATALLFYAVGSVLLAFFVRKGGMGALVAALVVTIVGLVPVGLMMLGGLVTGMSPVLCMMIVPLGLLLTQLVMLIAAMAKSGQVEQWQRYLSGGGFAAQWPGQGQYPPAPGYAYPGANPYSLPPAPPMQGPPSGQGQGRG